MTSLANEVTTISATAVSQKRRMMFLPRLFPRCYLLGERAVFKYADHFSADYRETGGYWNFYDLTNGSGFMAPATDRKTLSFVSNMNGYGGEFSPEAFGIVVTCFALTRCWEEMRTDELVRKLDGLKDYAAQHPEHAAIFAALD